MNRQISLLCVHGVSHSEADPQFRSSWTAAIKGALQRCDPSLTPTIDFLEYDDLFDKAPLNALTYGAALAKLIASSVVHGIGDLLPGARGLGDIPNVIRWTAGMVAQWSTDDGLRAKLRDLVLAKMGSTSYDMVLAHSLGSLICYDTFVRNGDAIKDKIFVSFGSQIGNPAVRDVFAGRIEALDSREWYHLFNPDDHVLTWRLDIAANNFRQVITEFDVPNDVLNHSATWYLSHANTVASVWQDAAGVERPRAFVNATRGMAALATKPTRRALLIGINDYPDPANRLEGCVNDVYLVSSVIQESGFEPEDIRIVLNDRATTQGIMDRLHWLLDGVRDGDQRMLFYSGHGAQMPGYDAKEQTDHVDECLVPVDFDWSPSHAILDKQFLEFYSQLPYDCHFVAMFDCCHSGGLTRDGGPRIRGLSPPDDIRHRALRWDPRERMWVQRELPELNRSLAKSKVGEDYVGRNGATRRLGRAMTLRTKPNRDYDRTLKELGHHGPYLPILLEACQEEQLSYEYRNGATSYGAYTFCMAQVLRENRARGINPSFAKLSDQVAAKLQRLKYDQTPNLVGPTDRCKEPLPWIHAAGQRARTVPRGAAKRLRGRAAKRSRRRSR